MTEPRAYEELDEIELLGRKVKVLDLGREVSPEMPHYPGHMKTNSGGI